MSLIYKVKSIEALYEKAKKIIIGKASALTNFNIGSRIRTQLEAIMTVLHESQYDFSKAMKAAIPLAVFNGFEFGKLDGIQSAGQLEFKRATPAGQAYPIPAGSAIILDGVIFETLVDDEISIGNTTSGQISSQCEIVGTVGNIGVNAIDTVSGNGSFVNQPLGVETAENPVAFAQGTDEESDSARLARFRDYINSLARSTPLGIVIGARSVEGVVSASIVEGSPSLGWITLYVDDGTGALPAALQTEVEKTINGDRTDPVNYPGYRAAGIQVLVTAPSVINTDVTMTIKILQSSLAVDADLETEVENEVTRYINSLTLGYDVTIAEIIRVAKNVNGDIFDVIVSLPVANVVVGASQVPRLNTFIISSSRVSP